jgi:deoxyribodipyrimidine photo-lyase
MSTSIALFTRDLRVHDNPVLHAAAAADRVIPLFVLDSRIRSGKFNRPNRGAFLADCLRDLDAGLRDRGGRLVLREGDVVDEVAALVRAEGVTEVHVAADVSGYAQARERRLRDALSHTDARLCVHDTVITAVAPGELRPTGGREHFAVFTPYHRQWANTHRRSVLPAPKSLSVPRLRAGKLPAAKDICAGETSPDLATGGERAARAAMRNWLRDGVSRYEERHDDLAGDGTSRLSPHLHFGSLSVTELVHATGTRTDGARAFVRQLAWRDFHHQVLAARPECAHTDYRGHGDRWRRSRKDFAAWQDGRTGYPIVDAGMRQLRQEGWLHNRARLIVGSFLAKTLYLDWRLGAAHFADLLVDGDIANNQLNWQWVAGTGTDTRPNRVLNPLQQAKRYDPDGAYVRRYVPELAGIDGPAVHQPWKLDVDYPEPLVDLREGAARFLRARGR